MKGPNDLQMQEPSPYFIRRTPPFFDGALEASYPPLHGNDGARLDLRKFWHTIRKHLWLVVTIPLLAVVLTVLRDVMAPALYTAQTTILIKSRTPQLVQEASAGLGSDTSSQPGWSDYLDYQTEYHLLTSRSLATSVIVVEGLAGDPMFTGAGTKESSPRISIATKPDSPTDDPSKQPVAPWLVNQYLGSLNVAPIQDSELVTVSFVTSNPELSARLANAHVQEFIRQKIRLNAEASDEAEKFLQKKLAELKQQLEESEVALNNYRRNKGIIPGLISVNGNEDVVLERLNKLSEQVQQAHLKTLNLGTQIALIDQGHADALPGVISNKMIQDLKVSLDNLETQYAAMSQQYKPAYPPMQNLSAKIQGTRDVLRQEIGSIVASIRAQNLANVKDEETLNQELKNEKDLALGLNDAGVKYAILLREADTNKELYNAVLKRAKDVEVTADLHASNISIVDKATAPLGPSSPRKRRDVMAAALLGLMAALGLAFLLEHHDNTFKDSEEVESYLRLPSLGVIPDFERVNGVIYGYAAKKMGSSGPAGYLPSNGKQISVSYGGHSLGGEAFRMIRTAVLLSKAGSPPKVTLIASAMPGEGKTTVSTNLAIAFASTGKRVVLVDADLRRPSCHRVFRVDNYLGLTNALTDANGLEDLVRATPVKGLFLLSSGERPPNPSELLGSDRMKEVIDRLKELYDFVILDSAPIIPVTDAVVLSGMVDGVILLADKRTRKQDVKDALSRLEYAHAKVFGVVLNKADFGGFGYRRYSSYNYPGVQDENDGGAGEQGSELS